MATNDINLCEVADSLQHVFRVGRKHNKFHVVMPPDTPTNLPDSYHAIVEHWRSIYEDAAIVEFDHVEYLGRG